MPESAIVFSLMVDGSSSLVCRDLRQVAGRVADLLPPPARVPARSAVVPGSGILRTTKGAVTINPTGNLGSTTGAITVPVRFAHNLYRQWKGSRPNLLDLSHLAHFP